MSEKIRNLFGSISGRYDLLNDLLSFGVHRCWRRKAVGISGARKGESVLDLAAGTGDFSIEFFKRVGSSGEVIATDFCEEMLDIAKRKFIEKRLPIKTKVVDAMNISFPDESFDYVSIAFGIRNVDDTVKCLNETGRVLKKGGKAVILEFGKPLGFFQPFFNLYSRVMMPLLGRIFAGSDSAYDYLRDSSARYPCRTEFTEIIEGTGRFKNVRYYTLSAGIAYVYIGEKI